MCNNLIHLVAELNDIAVGVHLHIDDNSGRSDGISIEDDIFIRLLITPHYSSDILEFDNLIVNWIGEDYLLPYLIFSRIWNGDMQHGRALIIVHGAADSAKSL